MELARTEHCDDERRLRRLLTEAVLEMRKGGIGERKSAARFVSLDEIRRGDGRKLRRKKVILTSNGCSVATCTMCSFTNENNYGLTSHRSRLVAQLAAALDPVNDDRPYDELALYNDGSFFSPREISSAERLEMAELISKSGVSRLTVESLPQFIAAADLTPFLDALADVQLEVGIGLQSASDFVRQSLVNTRISRKDFERALGCLLGFGVEPKVYLLIKPPFLTDGEAITDTVESVNYVRALGGAGVTLCPTRIAPHTVAWKLWERGHYAPPGIWTVVDIVRMVNWAQPVRVATLNLRELDYSAVVPRGCASCTAMVVNALERYSETGDVKELPARCGCSVPVVPEPLDRHLVIRRSLELVAGGGLDSAHSIRGDCGV